MEKIFVFSEKEIEKKKKVWILIFASSIVFYFIIVCLFLFLHNRENSIIFLILTYVLTILEVCLSLFYFLYVKKRLGRYSKILAQGKDLKVGTFFFKKESDEVLQDYLCFRQLIFADQDSNQEFSFYLLDSNKFEFKENSEYKIEYCSRLIFAFEGSQTEHRLPSSFKDSLGFDWWKYLLSSLVLCVAWHYIYQTKDALKDYEVLSIYSNCDVKTNDFINGIMSPHKEHGIEELSFNNIKDDAYTTTLLDSKGLLDGDIFIIYEKYIDSMVKSNSLVLGENMQEEMKIVNPCIDFLSFGEEKVGVKVFDIDDVEYNKKFALNSCFDFKQTTYLLLNSKSSNASINGNNVYSKCAIEVAMYLLKESSNGTF